MGLTHLVVGIVTLVALLLAPLAPFKHPERHDPQKLREIADRAATNMKEILPDVKQSVALAENIAATLGASAGSEGKAP